MSKENSISSREADRLYADLRARILGVDLAPGSVLDEARIVLDTGVSRTPVREAIIRLISEGLLKRDGRQVVVPSFRVGQLRPFFEGLQLLTRATHRMAAERRDQKQLRKIFEAHAEFQAEAGLGDPIGMNDANFRFHRAIGLAADSSFLQDAYDVILTQSLWLARQCFAAGADPEYTSSEHVTVTVQEHLAIYEAIDRLDVEETDRLASQHCDLFRQRLSRQMLAPSPQASELVINPASRPVKRPKSPANVRLIRARSGRQV